MTGRNNYSFSLDSFADAIIRLMYIALNITLFYNEQIM